MESKLIGKIAYITDKDSWYFGEWGTIDGFDGDVYYIKIANGGDSVPVFERNQFKVPRSSVHATKRNP